MGWWLIGPWRNTCLRVSDRMRGIASLTTVYKGLDKVACIAERDRGPIWELGPRGRLEKDRGRHLVVQLCNFLGHTPN